MYGTFHSAPKAPQTRAIFYHLISKGSISGLEAYNLYKARSLTRRIRDIKDQTGLKLRSEWRKDMLGQRYVRYFVMSK